MEILFRVEVFGAKKCANASDDAAALSLLQGAGAPGP